jgi:hypothetical protein
LSGSLGNVPWRGRFCVVAVRVQQYSQPYRNMVRDGRFRPTPHQKREAAIGCDGRMSLLSGVTSYETRLRIRADLNTLTNGLRAQRHTNDERPQISPSSSARTFSKRTAQSTRLKSFGMDCLFCCARGSFAVKCKFATLGGLRKIGPNVLNA